MGGLGQPLMPRPMWTTGPRTMHEAKNRVRSLSNRLNVENASPVGKAEVGRHIAVSPVKIERTGLNAPFPPKNLTAGNCSQYLGGVDKAHPRLSTDSLWRYKADIQHGSCYDGQLTQFPPEHVPDPEPLLATSVPMPQYSPRPEEKLTNDFRAHLEMLKAMIAHEKEIEAAKHDDSWRRPPPKAPTPEKKKYEYDPGEEVTVEGLQSMLVGFLESQLETVEVEHEQPELSLITPDRERQLQRLKESWPRRNGANNQGSPRKWSKPKGYAAKQWITKKTTPQISQSGPEIPVVEGEEDELSEENPVQIVIGVGDSAFVQSMEYYPKDRKLQIHLATGRSFWFYDVHDDFMEGFKEKAALNGGKGRSGVFTTSALFDSQFGRKLF